MLSVSHPILQKSITALFAVGLGLFSVYSLALLCAVPAARMDSLVLEDKMGALPDDAVVRTAFFFLPGTESFLPEIFLILVLIILWLVNHHRIAEHISAEKLVCVPLLAFTTLALVNVVMAKASGESLSSWAREFLPILVVV